MGISGCPGCGETLKHPNAVCTTFVGSDVEQVANAGRAVNLASPKMSWPVVILKGGPELAIKYGVRRNPFGRLNVLNMKNLLR
jgi:hypothetical protein